MTSDDVVARLANTYRNEGADHRAAPAEPASGAPDDPVTKLARTYEGSSNGTAVAPAAPAEPAEPAHVDPNDPVSKLARTYEQPGDAPQDAPQDAPPGDAPAYTFKSPIEGQQFDAQVIDTYSRVARELNLSQAQAQRVLDE